VINESWLLLWWIVVITVMNRGYYCDESRVTSSSVSYCYQENVIRRMLSEESVKSATLFKVCKWRWKCHTLVYIYIYIRVYIIHIYIYIWILYECEGFEYGAWSAFICGRLKHHTLEAPHPSTCVPQIEGSRIVLHAQYLVKWLSWIILLFPAYQCF